MAEWDCFWIIRQICFGCCFVVNGFELVYMCSCGNIGLNDIVRKLSLAIILLFIN